MGIALSKLWSIVFSKGNYKIIIIGMSKWKNQCDGCASARDRQLCPAGHPPTAVHGRP